MTAPKFGKPWTLKEDRGDARPYVTDNKHNVLLFDAPERILQRSMYCVNACTSIANPEALPELMDALKTAIERLLELNHTQMANDLYAAYRKCTLSAMPYDEAIKTYSAENIARIEAEAKLLEPFPANEAPHEPE